jgi:hypothetical protein
VRVRLRLMGHLCLFLCLASAVFAKDAPKVGIILYESSAGPAYVQATDILINGKNEVYVCGDADAHDNSSYKRLGKAKIATATSIDRDPKGVLRMTTAGGTACIAPMNLKLEKRKGVTPRELADMAVLTGRFVSRSANGNDTVPPQFAVGTRIVFVPGPDAEMAEYLRVTRKPTIALLREYLLQYPAAAHTNEVKQGLAGMITAEGESALLEYKQSVESGKPAYATLRTARDKMLDAKRVVPSFVRAEKLQIEIESLLHGILANGRAEVAKYNQAVNDRKAGYVHLLNAQRQVESVRVVDPGFPNLEKLKADAETQMALVERATASGEGLIAENKFDEAYAAIMRYAAFASELPRIAAIVDAAAHFHRDRGLEFSKEANWEPAIAEFLRALDYKEEAETRASLSHAETELTTLRNQAAAQAAIEATAPMVAAKQFIEAYESLVNLPDGQRKYVVEELEKLKAEYQLDLVNRANELTRLHIPINGRADEDAVRQAYDYLSKADKLADDDNIKVKLDLVSEKISEYYLTLANKQLDKPRGSGVGLGWHLLLEGQRYKRDQEMLRNQITKYAPAYDTRGRLSIAVQFRDQTSRRDSLGFADQMADTIASRLEAAGFRGVHVLTRDRIPSATDPNAAQPNFQIIGDIMQHRVEKKVDTQRLNSKYRAGTREVRNPAWLEVNRQLDTMKTAYERQIEANRAVIARNKKKEIEAANRQLEEMSRQIQAQKRKLDAIPETLLQDIIQPYNYTKRTFTLNAIVEVAFRANDTGATVPPQSDAVKVELPRTIDLLENVKAEDTEGVVEEGTPPDEIQLMADAEAQAQDQIMKKVNAWIESLPARVLQDARAATSRQDKEIAAERYVLYLNITPEKDLPERQEALRFLRDEFNVTSMKVP